MWCEQAGQKVNLQKSKIFVGPKTPRSLVREIQEESGIHITDNRGKSLGIPLFHLKVRKSTFNYII